MTIVITHYRYKRPPRRRKAVAVEVPVVVVAKVGSRRTPQAAADRKEPRPERTEAPPPTKPIVVVSISRKRARLLRWAAEGPIGQPSLEDAAFFARNVRPRGPPWTGRRGR